MQNVMTTNDSHEAHATDSGWSLSYGALAAIGLFALALVLRLMALDAVPVSVRETPDALAALRAVWPATPGESQASSSVAVFLAQAAGFTAWGSSALAARLLTALAGAVLVLTPLLFQRRLGASWAFAFSLALAFSPTLLLASRDSSADVWALLLVMVALWAFMRWRDEHHAPWAVFGSAAGASAALLTGWSGVVLTGIVLLAAMLTVRRSPAPLAEGEEEAGREPGRFPWLAALVASAGAVAIASTAFMLYPAGLDSVAAAVGGVIERFGLLAGPVPVHGLVASAFYETTAWLLGLAAFALLARRGQAGPVERFLMVWLMLAVIASLLFATGPAQSLWMSVPLAGLAGRLLVELLRADDRPGSWIPYHARWLVALVGGALLFIFAQAFQSFARSLAQAPAGDLGSAPIEPTSIILMAVIALFAAVVFVLGMNLWDRRTVWAGVGLAVVVFGGFASLGAGWHAAVPNAADPVEPWHLTATDPDTILLSGTLEQLSDRQTGGLPLLPVAVQGAQDGVLAWLVRDYRNAAFVEDAREAAGAEVFLTEYAGAPELGSAYVGQDFTLTRTWAPGALSLSQIPAWWAQRMVYPGARAATLFTTGSLFVRQDIYDGVEPGERG